VTSEAFTQPLHKQVRIQAQALPRSSEGSQAAKNMESKPWSKASPQAAKALELGLCARHRLLGPPVRWRAAHRSVFSDGSKFFQTRSHPQHSGKLAK
jgi:hypothetical protein